jgi:hypothetical protein
VFHFLIASERSGSNLLVKMLDAHSNICGPSPKHLLRIIASDGIRLAPLRDTRRWEAALGFIAELLASDFARWNTRPGIDALRDSASAGDLGALFRQVFADETRSHGKSLCFIKELQVYKFISILDWWFPDARYVYLVRDPRDMALSWRANPMHPGGLVAGAAAWRNDQSGTMHQFWARHEQGKALLVRYEDLVVRPEEELRRVCDLLGVEFEATMLDYHNDPLTRENAASNPAWENLSRGVMSDNFGKFQKELSEREIAIIERVCGGLMPLFGYLPVAAAAANALSDADVQGLHREETQSYRPKGGGPLVHDQVQQRLRKFSGPGSLDQW